MPCHVILASRQDRQVVVSYGEPMAKSENPGCKTFKDTPRDQYCVETRGVTHVGLLIANPGTQIR